MDPRPDIAAPPLSPSMNINYGICINNCLTLSFFCRKSSTHNTNDVLELEVQELRSALASVEAEMKERVAALTTKYNEMRDKDRKTISVLCALLIKSLLKCLALLLS